MDGVNTKRSKVRIEREKTGKRNVSEEKWELIGGKARI